MLHYTNAFIIITCERLEHVGELLGKNS